MSAYRDLLRKVNLFGQCSWQNDTINPFQTFLASIQGKTFLKSPSSTGYSGIKLANANMTQGKLYNVTLEVDSTNATIGNLVRTTVAVSGSTVQPIYSGGFSAGVKGMISAALCALTNANYLLFSNSANGQDLVINKTKLFEDRNWTDNIYNAPAENLIVNGNFASNTTQGWTAINSATLAVESGKLKVTSSTVSTPGARQYINTVLGRNYTLKFDHINGNSAGYVSIYNYNGGTWVEIKSQSVNNPTLTTTTINFTAGDSVTVLLFGIYGTTEGNTTYFNNISVTGGTIHNLLRSHFRADCSTANTYLNQIVSTVYNTIGQTATQATTTNQPLLNPNLLANGENRAYWSFDGTNDTLGYAEDMNNGQFDIWVVAKGNANSYLFSKGTGINLLTDINIDTTSGVRCFVNSGATTYGVTSSGVVPTTGINIVRFCYDWLGGLKVYLNGVLIPNTNNPPAGMIPNNTTNNCFLGSRCNAAFGATSEYETLSFSRTLTETEALNVLKYLRRRYGNEANF